MAANTTPSTASQAPAVSIEKDKEFLTLLNSWTKHKDNTNADIMAGHIKWTELIAHIDARLAQAREKGKCEAYADKLYSSTGYAIARAGAEELSKFVKRTEAAEARATAAEAKLEAIRQGVNSLVGYGDEHGTFVSRAHVLALLQPQHQADESGLPG